MDLFIALIPVIAAITFILITKRVILSLVSAVIIGALVAEGFDGAASYSLLVDSLLGVITDLSWYMAIVAFVIMIGAITAILTAMGATRSFAMWANRRSKSTLTGQLVAFFLGIIIFIDDYFNTLVVGEVSGPIADEQNVSRAKLSYIIDSTSAPVSVMVPFSTWGAVIVGYIGASMTESGGSISGMKGFINSIPYNFYSIAAVIFVALTIFMKLNFGPMKKFEDSSAAGNDESRAVNTELQEEVHGKSHAWVLPSTVLIIISGLFITWLGGANWNFNDMLDASITEPLVFGGLFGLAFVIIVSMVFKINEKSISKAAVVGAKSMLPAAVILISAWTLTSILGELGLATEMEAWFNSTNLSPMILPAIVFVVAAGVAFSTGTSWGTFGILLPLVIPLGLANGDIILYALIGATLGGAVLGDHCSPVSDTTVLSSTGARATLSAHFTSQLPYALLAGLAAFVAFLMVGITENLIVGYIALAGSIALITVALKVFVVKDDK